MHEGRNASPTSSAVVAEDALQVEGSEEEHAEEPDHEQAHDDVGAGDVARPKQAQRHQRVRDPRLTHDEGRQ